MQINDSNFGCGAVLIEAIGNQFEQIREWRQDLHAHPELGFEEVRTAELIADKLTQWGIPVQTGLGGTGVVGIVKSGGSDRAIGLRADMDALPMLEQNRFAHASRHPGKMHACGHDGHTAMLLATAQYLASHRDFDGTVYLIFQPAEEGGGGGNAMIEDGLFERFPMQAVFGMHNWPGLAAGQFAISPGPVMAAFNTFRIVVRGKGCHAAMPNLGLDPVPVAAQIVTALQTILTRNADPLEAGVISVTTLRAGEARNVIADCCEMTGTVRTFSLELMNLIERRMRAIAEHVCIAHDMECDFEFEIGYPPTINHPAPAAEVRRILTGMVGEANVLPQKPTMGAEDFAFMLQAVPGCYAFIGNGLDDHRSPGHGAGPCMLHNASYDFNDRILPLGATFWVRLVEDYLSPANGS